MNVFSYLDYRQIVKELVRERQKADSRFSFSILAEETSIQKTYLSKVINKTADLSLDQLFRVCDVFSLNDEEREFLELLLERERTAITARRQKLDKKIHLIQVRHLDTLKHLKAQGVNAMPLEELSEYYLDPYNMLVHTFLNIHKYQRNPEAITRSLRINSDQYSRITKSLEKLGIIAWNKRQGSYELCKQALQLSKDSPLLEAHQSLIRSLSFAQILRTNKNQRFNFQVTISADEKTRLFIHERFLDFLRDVEKRVMDANPVEVLQMNFDLFPWSEES